MTVIARVSRERLSERMIELMNELNMIHSICMNDYSRESQCKFVGDLSYILYIGKKFSGKLVPICFYVGRILCVFF